MNKKRTALFIPVMVIVLLLILGLLPQQILRYWNPVANWQSIANYFSWPIIGIITLISFLCAYEKPLSSLIENINIKTPNGYELSSSQKPDTSLLANESVDALKEDIKKINGPTTPAPSQENFIRALTASIDWRFRYARLFLVQSTKDLLIWIANNNPVDQYNIFNAWNNVQPSELQARLDALQSVEFIINHNGFYTLTNYGKAFLGLPIGVPPTF